MAASSKDWLLSEVEQLIAVWEGCSCLWDVTSKEYKDKNKKKEAMLEIATKFETTDEFYHVLFINISVTMQYVDEVAKKMKVLRAQHNREKNKVQAALRSGAGVDDIPKFNWVHYDHLNFLDEVAGKRTATRSNLTSQSQADELEDGVTSKNLAEERSVEGNDEDDDNRPVDNLPEIRRSAKKPLQGKRMSKKRRIEESENNLLERAAEALEKATMPEALEKAQCADDIFGQYVAAELKAIDAERLKKFVKHKIQTVIFECTYNMPIQMGIPPQLPVNNATLFSPPPARSMMAQGISGMTHFEPHMPVVRPHSRQEIFRTPSLFQQGCPLLSPSPSSSASPSPSLSTTDSQMTLMSV